MSIKILAVDDEPRNLLIIEEILEDEDMQLETCDSGDEAIEHIKTSKPDILLLDIMMDGSDGYDVCKKIKSESETENIKVILISGKAMLSERIQGYEMGADDYITKPFEPEELLAKIKVYAKLCQAEKDLQELNLTLEKQVKERADKFLQQETMAFIGSHVAEVIHDLNNPLTILKSHAKRLSSEQPENHRVSRILIGVEKIENLIKTILKAGRNDRETTRGPVNINQLLEDELDFLKTDKTFAHAINLTTQLSATKPVIAVPSHLSRIFGNLIKNAAEAMFGQEKKELSISTHDDPPYVTVEIKDTGVGIDEKNLEKMFDPFFTTKPAIAENDEPTGTGLGLASVKKMVDAYDGQIKVESKIGIGTTFTIKLKSSIETALDK